MALDNPKMLADSIKSRWMNAPAEDRPGILTSDNVRALRERMEDHYTGLREAVEATVALEQQQGCQKLVDGAMPGSSFLAAEDKRYDELSDEWRVLEVGDNASRS